MRCASALRPLIAGLAIAACTVACGGESPPLPQIGSLAPDPDGLSGWRRFAIDRTIDYRVASGARAGFVALVAREGRMVYARTSGEADIERGTPMRLDTRFQIASMTKPIIAAAALVLVDEGRLDLEAEVADYLPEFDRLEVVRERTTDGGFVSSPQERPLRVRHLLTFTSGIGGYDETSDPLGRVWRSPDIEAPNLGTLAERVALVPNLPLYEEPGIRWRYGWSADVLARVVEVAAERPLEAFLAARLFDPLGMTGTSYPDDVPEDAPMATMVSHDEDGELVRETRFDGWYGAGWTPGGGGLVSTAGDYMRFAMMLANGGELEGRRVLSRASVAEMTRLQVPDGVLADMGLEGLGWGYGLSVVADASATLMPAHDGDYWWSGRFGTQFWVSPATRTIVVVMQQTERSEWSDLPVTPTIVQTLASD